MGKTFRRGGGSYRCKWCGRVNDSKEDGDLCSSCQAENLAALQEAEWDRQREEKLLADESKNDFIRDK